MAEKCKKCDLCLWNQGSGGGGGGGGSSTLSGLTDVDIVNPENFEQLAYSSITHKWENVSPNTLYVFQEYDEATDTNTLSETWQSIYDAIAQGRLVYTTDIYEEHGVGMASGLSLVRTASHFNGEGTYKIVIDGTAGGSLALYEYEAASPDDYPVSVGA